MHKLDTELYWKGNYNCMLFNWKQEYKTFKIWQYYFTFPLRVYSINFVSHCKSAVVIPFLLMIVLWVYIWYKQTISISLEQDSFWNCLFFTIPNKEKIHCELLTIQQNIHKAADLWLCSQTMYSGHLINDSPAWIAWTIQFNLIILITYHLLKKRLKIWLLCTHRERQIFHNHYLNPAK